METGGDRSISRSHYHTPITAISAGRRGRSDKQHKAAEHQRERRTARQVLHMADDSDSRLYRSYGNPALGPKDGKQYRRNALPVLRK